jgi:hypothetical protein
MVWLSSPDASMDRFDFRFSRFNHWGEKKRFEVGREFGPMILRW